MEEDVSLLNCTTVLAITKNYFMKKTFKFLTIVVLFFFVGKAYAQTNLALSYLSNTSPTNQGGQIAVYGISGVNTYYWYGNYIGQSGTISAGRAPNAFTDLRFYYLGDLSIGYGDYHTAITPIANFNLLPYGGQITLAGTHNSVFTITKLPGYSVAGTTYEYLLNISFYTPF